MSSNNKTEILIQYKKLLSSFCDELIEQFPNEGDFRVAKVILDSGQMSIDNMMTNFIHNTDDKMKEMIRNKDEKFFLEENPFSFLSNDRFDKFSRMWTSDNLDDEDKTVLWEWMDALVKISNKYKLLM
jgi:hypothetical protein